MDNGMCFHTMEAEEVIRVLQSRPEGLTDAEAGERFGKYGANALEEGKKRTLPAMFLEQFKNFMVIVLLMAAVISATVAKETADAAIILFVVLLNAVLGVIQESKAEKALAALKKMSSPHVKVRRGGNVRQIKTEELVPGDIVLLEAGDVVPADMRLLESASLKIEEAALTGESVPVEKVTEPLKEKDLVIGDRKNMAYSGSHVTYGRGVGIVTQTGMKTEVGKIAGHLAMAEDSQTPLQRKLNEMSRILSIGVLLVCLVMFAVGLLQGRETLDIFMMAVSLAVAAIPEGLAAVVTIVLAIGVQRMAKKNAIIRKLSAVETLGSTQIICSDKTGTLTQNKMTVKAVYMNGKLMAAEEASAADGHFRQFIRAIMLCNDSKMDRKGNEARLLGDPTETALVEYGMKMGLSMEETEKGNPRVAELPFDSERKLMTTVHQSPEGVFSITKGAPDVLIERCNHILEDGNVRDLTDEDRKAIVKANKEMADQALRVLAVARKTLDRVPETVTQETMESGLAFIGLVGMIDPPREEAKEAVRICKQAGIRPIMITGDHRDTAAAIARELGIARTSDEVITGSQLSALSDEAFNEQVDRYSVYARVSPEHKVRIVKAWKHKGKIVAMTGDGVNDAPALKSSDIGVGMGITGTEVSKGVSDMVLADDNFATIVHAVREGRKIYSNIRKTVQFLLSCNLGEVFTLFIATLLPALFSDHILFPIHILWINLITDTLPALALGMEQAEPDVMNKPPRDPKSSFFADRVGFNIIYQGILEGSLVLIAYLIGRQYSPETATTMAFVALGLIQLFHSFNTRSNEESVFRLGLFSNPWLIGAFLLSALLQLSVVFLPFLNGLFRVTPLTVGQWLTVIGLSFLMIPIVEAVKWIERRIWNRKAQ